MEKRIYEVQIEFKNKKSMVAYESSVGIEIRNDESLILHTIEKSHFFVDGVSPSMYIDELAIKASSCLFPLIVGVRPGSWTIINHNEIVKRWYDNLSALCNNHFGSHVENYLSQMEALILESDKLMSSLLRNDIFLALMLNNVQVRSRDLVRTEKELLLPIGGYNHPVIFKGHEQIASTPNRYGGVLVNFKGKSVQYYWDHLELMEYSLDANIEYNLSTIDHSVLDIEAEVVKIKKEEDSERVLFISIYSKD